MIFVDAPYIKEFPVNLECKIIHVIELGLHTQFIGEVMDAKIDDTIQEKRKSADDRTDKTFNICP